MNSINSLVAQNYSTGKAVLTPDPSQAGSAIGGMASDFATTLQNSESVAMEAMTGKADSHALVQALAQTELAVQTAVTIRDKVVEAYQEILRMPM